MFTDESLLMNIFVIHQIICYGVNIIMLGNLILVKSPTSQIELLEPISIDYNMIQYSTANLETIEPDIHYTELDDIPNRYVILTNTLFICSRGLIP